MLDRNYLRKVLKLSLIHILLVGNFKKSLRGTGLMGFFLCNKELVFIDSPFCFENVFIFASNSPLFDQKQRFFRLSQPRLS